MNELERDLKKALAPVDPGDRFTQAVMARVRAQPQSAVEPPRQRPRVLQWLPAALAASLLMTIVMKHDERRTQELDEGLRARDELIAALRVTSEKLDLAYQVVQNESAHN